MHECSKNSWWAIPVDMYVVETTPNFPYYCFHYLLLSFKNGFICWSFYCAWRLIRFHKEHGISSMNIAGYVSVCVQLYCVGFHCFTTCFGLQGHLQVCRIFYFHMFEGFCFAAFFTPTWSHSADKHTRKQETRKTEKTNGNVQSVTVWRKKNSKAESFKHMKIKYPTHLKMAM
jgi:hypothetical protein